MENLVKSYPENDLSHFPEVIHNCLQNGVVSVRDYIAAEIEKRGMNPRTFAIAAKVNVSTLHRILNDQGEPRRTTLEPIARYLGVTVDDMYLANGGEPPSAEERALQLYEDLMALPREERAALLAKIAESLA